MADEQPTGGESAAEPKQAKGATGAAAPQPKTIPELAHLASWAGAWSCVEHYEVGPSMPQGGNGLGRSLCRIGPGGAVIEEYHSTGSPMGPFEAVGVFTWDAAKREYVMHWFDSFMPAGQVSRGRRDGDCIVFEGGGEKHRWRMTYTSTAEGRVLEAEQAMGDGPLKKGFSITYRKDTGATRH